VQAIIAGVSLTHPSFKQVTLELQNKVPPSSAFSDYSHHRRPGVGQRSLSRTPGVFEQENCLM
jgi:hypothetical protein